MKLPQGKMTNWLVATAVAAFAILYAMGQIDFAALAGGFVPLRISDGHLFAAMGGPDWVPAWATPLTAMWLHASWMHIGFNMLMLFFCGRHVEHVLGARLLLLLYGVTAYAAAAAEWAVHPMAASPMIGASGGISGIIGTYALLYSQQKVKAIGPISANVVRLVWLAAGWTAIQLMLGFATRGVDGDLGNIAIAAHIGGFVAGLVITRPLLLLRFRRRTSAPAE